MEKVEGEGEERVEPAPLQVALLYKILKAQRETLEFLKSITPEGVDVPIPNQTVSDITVVDFIKNWPFRPLRSLDPIFNEGPNTAYVRVNEEAREREVSVQDREKIAIVKPKAIIKYVTLRVVKGYCTTIRITGHY